MNKINNLSNVIEGSNAPNHLYISDSVAGKVINLLRSSLYSDKWGSFIREVVSNAYDANKASSYEGAVEICLPNIIKDELLIKDYGLGMSKEFMEKYYTNVGFSSKELVKDQIGAYGIGRLTPLLIADSYKIETIHEGKKYIYTMAVGEKHGLVLEYEGDTSLPSGTIIRIPCHSKHNKTIMTQLEHWCRFMTPLPLVDGIPIKGGVLNSYIGLENETWWKNTKAGSTIVLKDWVPYTVKNDVINEEIKKHISHKYSDPGLYLIIKFDADEFNVTASREQLEYTEATIKAIQNKIKLILNTIKNNIRDTLNKATSLKEVCACIYQYPHSIYKEFIWRDINLGALNLGAKTYRATKYTLDYKNELNYSRTYSYENLLEEPNVFLDDLGSKPKKSRILKYLVSSKSKQLFVIPKSFEDEPVIKQMEWPLLSSLPLPPKEKRELITQEIKDKTTFKVNSKEIKAYKWMGYVRDSLPNLLKYSDPISLNTDSNGICLIVDRGELVEGLEGYNENGHIITTLRALSSYLPDGSPLYLIPKSTFPLMKGNWVLLDEYYKRLLSNKLVYYAELYQYCGYLIHDPIVDGRGALKDWTNDTCNLKEIGKYLDLNKEISFLPDSLFGKLVNESIRIKTLVEQYSKEIDIARYLVKPDKDFINIMVELYKQVKKKYPLLQYIRPCNSIDSKNLIDYIRGIDALNQEGNNQ